MLLQELAFKLTFSLFQDRSRQKMSTCSTFYLNTYTHQKMTALESCLGFVVSINLMLLYCLWLSRSICSWCVCLLYHPLLSSVKLWTRLPQFVSEKQQHDIPESRLLPETCSKLTNRRTKKTYIRVYSLSIVKNSIYSSCGLHFTH